MRKTSPLLSTPDNSPCVIGADGFHPDFSLKRLCHSDTAQREGICNEAPPHLVGNLARLSQLLGAIQGLLDARLSINSGFRCDLLNERVGGVPGSQHCEGLAADISCKDLPAHELAHIIAHSRLDFDQLILEYGRWVHVSTTVDGQGPRRELLTIRNTDEGYLAGLILV